jgi:hypothetical protein
MLTVVLIVLAVASVWALVAVLIAFLAGGVIHARDHRDAPYGGFSRPHPQARPQPRPIARLAASSRTVH